jgi:hypothetical protein
MLFLALLVLELGLDIDVHPLHVEALVFCKVDHIELDGPGTLLVLDLKEEPLMMSSRV